MSDRKIFTYVSPKSNAEIAISLCAQMPIILKSVNTVEELFPLMSDANYYTDFICISIEMFYNRTDSLDMFDIINTLSTLIKSTVHRLPGGMAKKRDTKIFVIVDETTDVKLIKEVMSLPNIVSVGWIIKTHDDYESSLKHIANLVSGNYAHHDKVLEMIKPKKKPIPSTDAIILTARQEQVLTIVQERGASNKIIAKMLGLSESTVKLHIGAVLKKFGAKNRTQLALFSRDKKITRSHL